MLYKFETMAQLSGNWKSSLQIAACDIALTYEKIWRTVYYGGFENSQ